MKAGAPRSLYAPGVWPFGGLQCKNHFANGGARDRSALCGLLEPFIQAGKAVFGVEYELDSAEFCSKANAMDFDFLVKDWDLNAWREACR